MQLLRRTILITGGATGIGYALAAQLWRCNTVIVCGRRETSLAAAALALPGLVTRRCDLCNSAERRALVAWLRAEYPALDVLINNAGIQKFVDFTQSSDEDSIIQEVSTNFVVPALLANELIPHLIGQDDALIVNISSGLGFCPLADAPIYSATKAALHSLSLSLRWQLRHAAIRVVELIPPIVATDLAGPSGHARRSSTEDPPVITSEAFAAEALRRLEAGETEIAVGIAEGLRLRREDMFALIND